jgi:hypothetical protein
VLCKRSCVSQVVQLGPRMLGNRKERCHLDNTSNNGEVVSSCESVLKVAGPASSARAAHWRRTAGRDA